MHDRVVARCKRPANRMEGHHLIVVPNLEPKRELLAIVDFDDKPTRIEFLCSQVSHPHCSRRKIFPTWLVLIPNFLPTRLYVHLIEHSALM